MPASVGKVLAEASEPSFCCRINGDLAALRFGHEQIGQAVAIDVGPEQAAAGFVGFVERQNLELALLESRRKGFGWFASELGDLRAAGVLGDGDDLGFVVRFEIVGPIRADGREGEIIFGPKLAVGLSADGNGTELLSSQLTSNRSLRPSPSISSTCDGFDGAGEGNFDGFVEGVILLLGDEIDVVFGEQDEVGAAIAIQIAGVQGVGDELAVFDGPAFGRAPGVGALVV